MSTPSLPRVLLVHDEPSQLAAIGAVLTQGGYEVVSVVGTAEALAHLRGQEVGLVLADTDLQNDAGRLLLSELRLRWPETVGVVLTDHDAVDSTVDALREGACDYVVKPCPAALLKAVIGRAMERGALARALRRGLEDLDEANAQLTALSGQLQQRVDEATAALRDKVAELDELNRQLRDAQAQREALNAMVAHDLGGPLTAMAGYLQLLDRPRIRRTTKRRARAILASEVQRLIRLVADLTDAQEVATGGFAVQLDECDLVELVREQVELARVHAGRRPIRLDVPDQPIVVRCDRQRIAQVVSNLLANAIKYAPRSAIQVGLWAGEAEVYVAISDAGPGIPPEQLEAIFGPRVRLTGDGSTGHRPGRGLGLHIAREIVARHGGRIWAEARPGGGATFNVCLPRRPAAAAQPPERPLALPAPLEPPPAQPEPPAAQPVGR